MRKFLTYAFCLLAQLALTFPDKADVPWRIPNYSSYVELNDGTVFCGDMYDSWHEGRTGNVCAGGQYDSWHEGRTGEVACGGKYTSFHKSSAGKVCFGGLYQPASFSKLNLDVPSRETTGTTASAAPQATKLMIFGGENHKTYLGCLNCSEYEPDSVKNKFGENGSPYSSSSIWNHYSDYGSQYTSGGACNSYATDPPVIVDQNGKYYGRLSLNRYHPELGVGAKLYDWLKKDVCGR